MRHLPRIADSYVGSYVTFPHAESGGNNKMRTALPMSAPGHSFKHGAASIGVSETLFRKRELITVTGSTKQRFQGMIFSVMT